MDRFDRGVAAIGFLVALGIVGYVVIFKEGDAATVALGALVGVVGAAVGWYFRGKVQNPEAGQVTVTAEAPATASVRTTEPAREAGRPTP